MPVFICRDCAENRSDTGGSLSVDVPVGSGLAARVLSPLKTVLGAAAGALLGLLTGNPVIVAVSACVGAGLASTSHDVVGLDATDSALLDSCEICGAIASLETCSSCKNRVCASCRQLVMAREDCDGRSVLRHYEKVEGTEEAGSLALAPWYLSDVDSGSDYRLSDEAYTLDEETGELIPVPEAVPDNSISSPNPTPTDEWGFDSASVSPATDDWEGSDSWSSADSDIDSWDADSADAEGG